MAESLFVYGTLLDHRTQKQVFGRVDPGLDGILPHHKRVPMFIDGQKYMNIVPDTHASVEGKILTVSKKELEKIDLYEEPEFRREQVTLKDGERVWVYLHKKEKSEGSWI